MDGRAFELSLRASNHRGCLFNLCVCVLDFFLERGYEGEYLLGVLMVIELCEGRSDAVVRAAEGFIESLQRLLFLFEKVSELLEISLHFRALRLRCRFLS